MCSLQLLSMHVGVKTTVHQCGYATVALCFSVHVGVKTLCSECVYCSYTLWFSVHVGVETSVNVVTI